MKCRYCGQQIPEGVLYCEACGKEVRIVPDYNPLDDMLTAQVKVSISDDELESVGRNGSAKNRTGRVNRNTSSRQLSQKEQRRRKAERQKALRRKRRRVVLGILAVILVLTGGIGTLLYQTSYAGLIRKGEKALSSGEMQDAENYYAKAISKKPERAEGYDGLAKVYLKQDDKASAENVYLDAIGKYPKNSDIYESCINFYLDTDQQMEIPSLLEDADKSVQKALAGYVITPPDYSLDEETTYDDVQELSLTAKGLTIYYTTDGSDPTTSSTKYTGTIHLEEGETVVNAIAVNKKGVPSLAESKTYKVELPIEDAPAVSPSTGQYDSAVQIEIKVPEGYEAYYTMDGETPTNASKKYSGPIDMPEGETLFKAVLVNAKGRTSGVTTRNYVLETAQ